MEAFKSLLGKCYFTCAVILACSLLCLLWDLGSPHKALLLFTRPKPTVLTFGAFSLVALLAVTLVLACINYFKVIKPSGFAKRILEIVCCALSVFAMSYTGLFLMEGGIPFWNTFALVALFIFSSLSTGISLVLLVDYFVQGKFALLGRLRPIQKAHIACLLLESISLALFIMAAYSNPHAASSLALLVKPHMLANLVVGAVGMGIATPLVLESFSLAFRNPRVIPLSDAICLIGGFLLRYCVVVCGVHWSGPLA